MGIFFLFHKKYVQSVIKYTIILYPVILHHSSSILKLIFFFFRIYNYNDATSFWKLLDDNTKLLSTKIPKNLNVFQIVNSWIRNKNYPLITLEVQGDDIILKQVIRKKMPVNNNVKTTN